MEAQALEEENLKNVDEGKALTMPLAKLSKRFKQVALRHKEHGIKVCPVCHKSFNYCGYTRKYCSPECKQKAKASYLTKEKSHEYNIKRIERIRAASEAYYKEKHLKTKETN